MAIMHRLEKQSVVYNVTLHKPYEETANCLGMNNKLLLALFTIWLEARFN